MKKGKKEVLVLLTVRWCDWEASYAIAVINSFTDDYVVKAIASDYEPKVSMGGVKAAIDYSIKEYENYDNSAMVIRLI